MKRTRLSNKFIESKTDANRTPYNKQRDHCQSDLERKKGLCQ